MVTSGERLVNEGLLQPLSGQGGLRLGIMGGAFDPIHMAHLVTAEEARVQFDLDQVVFMPAGDPPHKGRRLAPAESRYLLVSVATASHPRFSVSRFEIDRPGVSYTVDTLEHLTEVTPRGTELYFITGADAVLDILTWKDPARVLELATFIAATRPGYDLSKLSGLLDKLRADTAGLVPEARVKMMEIPALAISSSLIRERLAAGRGVRYLVPEAVAQILDKSGVYAEVGAGRTNDRAGDPSYEVRGS
jgi:nicotinate-nucleotide adenylyltransferase